MFCARKLLKTAIVAASTTATIMYNKKIAFADENDEEKKKLVILGSGWTSLTVCKYIDTNQFDVKIISPRNYFLFSPYLAHVATGSLGAISVTEPLREFIGKKFDAIEYIDASAESIDPVRKTVTFNGHAGSETVAYDRLVVAVGGASAAPEHTRPLCSLDDAEKIRRDTVRVFERACSLQRAGADAETLNDAVRLVVVGGAPESSEVAGRLVAFARYLQQHQYPELSARASVHLIEASSRSRNVYDSNIMKQMAAKHLSGAEIERIEAVVRGVEPGVLRYALTQGEGDAGGLEVELPWYRRWFGGGPAVEEQADERLPFALCVWAAPRQQTPIAAQLCEAIGAEHQSHAFAIQTDDHLRVRGAQDIFAAGDCATITQGRLVERVIDLFKELDVNKDGTLDTSEFRELVDKYSSSFPQLSEWADHTDQLFAKADVNGDGMLSEEEFRNLLVQVDSKLTRLPSSAQTAYQQGTYLARILSSNKKRKFDPLKTRRGASDINKGRYASDNDGNLPFRYKHFGGFEYVGYDEKITKRGTQASSILDGFGATWLWRSVFVTRVVRKRQLARIQCDRLATKLTGRDTTND